MAFAPGTKGNISVGYVALQPVDPDNVPSGALSLDATNGGALTIKDTGGGVSQVTPTSQSDSIFLKLMQNLSGSTILANIPVAKKLNGSIVPADSDDPLAKVTIGITMTTILNTESGTIMLLGPNAAGVITGLGFLPGQAIYVSPSAGFTNNTNDFLIDDDISNDAIIRIGYADCAAGSASSAATDLILFAGVEAVG